MGWISGTSNYVEVRRWRTRKTEKTNTGKIFVTAEDLEQIKQRMAEFGTDNLSAHLRKLDLRVLMKSKKKTSKRKLKNFPFKLRKSVADFTKNRFWFWSCPKQVCTGV